MGYSEKRDTPKTQQATSKNTTGKPGFKASRAGNLITALTVVGRGVIVRAVPRLDIAAAWGRNILGPEHHSRSCVAFHRLCRKAFPALANPALGIEVTMATQRQGHIVETPTEARQAEPGPSVLALLTVSTGLAVLILGVIWFVFFRT
jgi:hypothetical protein